MKNIIIIGNPIAGGGALRRIEKAARICETRGHNVQVLLTTRRGDAERFAREIASEKRNDVLVVAAGGDGTYNEVANGLVRSSIPMAILPMGTTSVLAKEMDMPGDIERATDMVLNGQIQSIHLGRITTPVVTRYFLLMAGIGFDGEVVGKINEKIKRTAGRSAYILSGLSVLFTYRPAPLTVTGKDISLMGYATIVSNAACYGGTFKVAPDARLTDPSFYVFVTHKKGRLSLLRYVAGILGGFHLSFKDITYFKTEELTIEGNAPIQIDGDYIGNTPAKIEIARHALRLVVRG